MDQQFRQKLQHKDGYRRLAIRMPVELRSLFDNHLDDLLLQEATYIHELEDQDAVIIFLRDQEEFLTYVKWFDALLKPKELVRIAYPKQEGSIASDLNRDKLRQFMKQMGWDAVRHIVLNEMRGATRFKYLNKS